MSKMNTKHGMAGSQMKKRERVYRIWAGMMDRCEWGGHPSYERYGKKGIRVCERWHDFENFLNDMGRPPSEKHSIDRINSTKGYFPDNCRWASRHQQNINTSRSLWFQFEGEILHISQICNRFNLSLSALKSRATRRNGDYEASFLSFGFSVKRLQPSEWS